MSSIPGAHASLGFGRKQIEFYAAPGVTAGAGQRRGEHEIRDAEGRTQSFRLSRPDTPLESGETVTVLRAQSGPDHGSRPVAVVNHDRNAWTRTMPEATTVLSQSGITRAANWWLAMLTFILASLVMAWPDLRLFMLEVDPALFASLPDFNVFALVAAQVPGLAGFDLAAAIPGFTDLASQTGLTGLVSAQALAFAVPLTLLAILTYASRSWRVVWVPVYVFAAIVAGLALGAASPVTPALLSIGGVMLLFAIGGFINRTRDSSRFEGRVSRLAENILRHPPAESVSAPAATAMATAAAAATVIEAPEAEAEVEAEEGEPAEDEAETPVESDETEDELPSDEALAAARAEDGETDTPSSPQLGATQAEAELADEPPADRDMILPPPPPMANRAVSEAGESGEVGASEVQADAMQVEAETSPEDDGLDAALAELAEAAEATPSPDAEDAVEIGAAPDIAPDAVIPMPAPEMPEDTAEVEAANDAEPEAPNASEDASDDEADPFLSSEDDRPRQD